MKEFKRDPKERALCRALSLTTLFLLIFVLLSGCAGKSEGNHTSSEPDKKVSDYFPARENVKYVYEGQGNEFASYTVYNDYVSGDMLQQRKDNGGTTTVQVFRIKDGKVSRMLSKGEVYYREDMRNQDDESEEVLLAEPLKKGTSWQLKDNGDRTVTGTDTQVETPMGTFPCIEVITEGNDGTTTDYYAKGIGLVKTVFQSGDTEVSSTLKSVEENAAETQTVRFYYPDISEGRIHYVEKEVSYHTNDSTATVLENAYKETVSEELGVVLPTGAAIRSLSLNEDNKVHLDLNDVLEPDTDAGGAYETMALQCIADTFGNYYGSDQVMITVGGKPYESKHIKLQQNESIPVNLAGITERKQ